MTRNARTQERRPSLCHVGERAAATARAGERGRGDNFSAYTRSNAERGPTERGSIQRREAGARFETHALTWLQRQRLVFVARNVHCRGGELDLVMRERDGTLVFVEVRARTRAAYGGAAASVGWHKRQRLLRAAREYLLTYAGEHGALPPACRFDVVTFEGGRLTWLRDAFREDES
nr:YraN family protein [Paraburkholderia eburnea]